MFICSNPGLCLLGIGGAPYISHKIMAQKAYSHIFDFFSETTSASYTSILLKPRPLLFVQNMVKLHLQAIWQDFKYGKMQNFGFCVQDI